MVNYFCKNLYVSYLLTGCCIAAVFGLIGFLAAIITANWIACRKMDVKDDNW